MLSHGPATDRMTWMELRGLACFLAWLLAIRTCEDEGVSDASVTVALKRIWMETGKVFLREYPSWTTGEDQDALLDMAEWLHKEKASREALKGGGAT